MKKIKRDFKKKAVDLLIEIQKKKETNEKSSKVLIISTDALGDIAIKEGLYNLIVERHGKENTFFIINDKWESIIKRLGFNIFHSKTRKEKYGVLARVKLVKKINDFNFDIIYSLDMRDPELDLKYLKANQKNAFITDTSKEGIDNFIEAKKTYRNVIDKLWSYGKIVKKDCERADVIPDLRRYYIREAVEGIVVGVGASNKERIATPNKMVEIIEKIIEKKPNEKIYLVGSGEKQRKYAKQLTQKIKSSNVIDLVDKMSLLEVVERINKSKFYIGFDSGLFNIAYSLRKKTIGIFGNISGFEHREDYVAIISVSEKPLKIEQGNLIKVTEVETDNKDKYFGNRILNNFNVEVLDKALEIIEE